MAIFNVSSYMPNQGERYFLDCNILMYMFYTNGDYAADIVYDYSSLITRIINAKSEIMVTDMLISEFLNTYIQTEFHRLARINNWSHTKNYFKRTFKFSREYQDILHELKLIITHQILPISTSVNVDFKGIKLDTLFDNPTTFDFNDRYYGYAMNLCGAYIVTNDADFSDVSQCNIITRNAALLSE